MVVMSDDKYIYLYSIVEISDDKSPLPEPFNSNISSCIPNDAKKS